MKLRMGGGGIIKKTKHRVRGGGVRKRWGGEITPQNAASGGGKN